LPDVNDKGLRKDIEMPKKEKKERKDRETKRKGKEKGTLCKRKT